MGHLDLISSTGSRTLSCWKKTGRTRTKGRLRPASMRIRGHANYILAFNLDIQRLNRLRGPNVRHTCVQLIFNIHLHTGAAARTPNSSLSVLMRATHARLLIWHWQIQPRIAMLIAAFIRRCRGCPEASSNVARRYPYPLGRPRGGRTPPGIWTLIFLYGRIPVRQYRKIRPP